jgi:hypothetical protein
VAKSQKKSKWEVRKPKAAKPKPAAANKRGLPGLENLKNEIFSNR